MRLLTEQEIRDRYYQDGIEDGKKEMAERAEKAEGELKAIRGVITRYENGSCLQKCEKYCSDCLAKEIIKQIGVKNDT